MAKKVTPSEDAADLTSFHRATDMMTTDRHVKETAIERAPKGRANDLDTTKGGYDWITRNTYREPKVRGCGGGQTSRR